MFVKKSKAGEPAPNLGLRLFRLAAWGLLGALWLFILFLMGCHWFVVVPATRDFYEAGLEQGFDALAGIVAAADPQWENVRSITGRPVGGRLNRLQGDTMFNVWLDHDEVPGWHSGLAALRFDKDGRLVWARRYFRSEPPVMAANPNTGETFPVVKPRPDLRGRGRS